MYHRNVVSIVAHRRPAARIFRRTARRALAPSSLPRRPSRPNQHVSRRPRRRVRRRRSRGVVPPRRHRAEIGGVVRYSAPRAGRRCLARAPFLRGSRRRRVGRRPARERRRGFVVPHRFGRGLHRHGLRRRRLAGRHPSARRSRVHRAAPRVGQAPGVRHQQQQQVPPRVRAQVREARHLGREGGGFLRRLRRRRVPQDAGDEEEGVRRRRARRRRRAQRDADRGRPGGFQRRQVH